MRENPKGQPRVLKVCVGCGEERMIWRDSKYCSIRCGKLGRPRPDVAGENNHSWKGDRASYRSLHYRVYSARGKASERVCRCGKRWAREWASLMGNYADIWDYEAMCKKCHAAYDAERRRAS